MNTPSRQFTLKREIDLGQILTIMSIVGSMFAFIYAWDRDRTLKDKEYADRVRKSAATVTAKIERWGELSARFFEDIQPVIVDVSEKAAQTKQRQPANRMLFKGLMEARAKASQRIVDEQLQIAYMELYGYAPSFQKVFDKTIEDIRIAEFESQERLQQKLQDRLLDKQLLALGESPQIGNQLRNIVELERINLRDRIAGLSKPLRSKMLEVIKLPDANLRSAQESEALQAIFAR